LDEQALEGRRGSNFELLTQSEEQWIAAIDRDGGHEWRCLVRSGWRRYSRILRYLAQQVSTQNLARRPSRLIVSKLVLLEIAAIIKRATDQIPSLHGTRWWDNICLLAKDNAGPDWIASSADAQSIK
jgi:hypothetical protein